MENFIYVTLGLFIIKTVIHIVRLAGDFSYPLQFTIYREVEVISLLTNIGLIFWGFLTLGYFK